MFKGSLFEGVACDDKNDLFEEGKQILNSVDVFFTDSRLPIDP